MTSENPTKMAGITSQTVPEASPKATPNLMSKAVAFGLSEKTLITLMEVFKRYPTLDKVVLYGSRAKGNFKNGSDIDLTLMGEALTHQDMLSIYGDFDDSSIPYMVDVSIFEEIDNPQLRSHIERVGVVLYERDKACVWC